MSVQPNNINYKLSTAAMGLAVYILALPLIVPIAKWLDVSVIVLGFLAIKIVYSDSGIFKVNNTAA